MGNMQRALISLTDKTGIEDFAGELQSLGIEILSTGGTAKKMPAFYFCGTTSPMKNRWPGTACSRSILSP